MSAESEAALNELRGLKADLDELAAATTRLRAAALMIESANDADRQALIDLQAQMATLRADLGALRSANGLQ